MAEEGGKKGWRVIVLSDPLGGGCNVVPPEPLTQKEGRERVLFSKAPLLKEEEEDGRAADLISGATAGVPNKNCTLL